MALRYFEDFELGETYSLDSCIVTHEEIVEFAERYDPQRFHIDPDAAAETMFGDLIASGWHTASLCMRQLVEELFAETAIVGALGVDDLRWRKPVYSGDELDVTTTPIEKDIWDDCKGLVTFDLVAHNQVDELVHARQDLVLIERTEG